MIPSPFSSTIFVQVSNLISSRRDYKYIFQPILERVQDVLATQLELAMEKGKDLKVWQSCIFSYYEF